MSSLKDRINGYETSTHYKILPKLPLVFEINGRSFNSTLSLLDKPFDEQFHSCLSSTMKKLCVEIEGAQLGYLYNDKIIIISKNDQSINTLPWFNNNLTKLSSITSSIATSHFSKCANHIGLSLFGDPIFYSHIYPVPNLIEVINAIIYHQQLNFFLSLQFACYYELINKYNKSEIKKKIFGMTYEDKISLLKNECNISFDNYDSRFRFGSLCLKSLINGKNEWNVIDNVPSLASNQDFLREFLSS